MNAVNLRLLALSTLTLAVGLAACSDTSNDTSHETGDETGQELRRPRGDAGTAADGAVAVDAGSDARPAADAGSDSAADTGVPGADAGTRTLHYGVNVGSDLTSFQGLGFGMLDVAGSTTNPAGTKARVDALPAGMRALVWVGNLDNTNCSTPGFTLAQFEALVDVLAGDPRVFGYFLSDEPHPMTCTSAAVDIRTRADYIHAHAPGQIAFITALDGSNACGANLGCEYQALAPANTHVDLVGLDPYPCHYDTAGNPVPCDDNAIRTKVNLAVSKGIPTTAIVPVFDEFGQEGRLDGKAAYYRTPSANELTSMLATWATLVPHPAFDFAYTFGVQCTTTTCPAPQAIVNHPELQTIVGAHNAK